MSNLYKELYDQSAERQASYAGDLGAMAFVAQELLRVIDLGLLDSVRGKNRIRMMKKELHKYYQGKGSSSVFARTFEEGIEAGMKEAV